MKKIRRLFNSNEPLKWLFWGDSITQGSFHTFGHRDYTELFSERIRFEMRRKLDIVINSAMSGSTSEDLIRTLDHCVLQFLPDVTFLMIGINDCYSENAIPVETFKDNLLYIVGRLKQADTFTILQTPNTTVKEGGKDADDPFPFYIEAMYEVADSKDIAVIDHFQHWQDRNEKSAYWMNDKKHPNKYGHRVMADLIFQNLAIRKEEYATSGLFIP